MQENMKLANMTQNIVETVPEFKKLPLKYRNWLISLYTDNYTRGLRAIGKDIFLNPGYVTTQALLERIKEHPEVSVHETEFMQDLAEADPDALDSILDETDEQDDFVYGIYEQNYIDWIPKSVRKFVNIPETLVKYDLDLLAQEAFSQGLLWILDKLARQAIVKFANDTIKEQEL